MLALTGPIRTYSAKVSALAKIVCAILFVFFAVYTYTRVTVHTRVYAATSSNLNFQARLLNSSGSVVPDGYYNVEFKLYSVASGGAAEWTETRTAADKVRVVNGYLSVSLGEVTAFSGGINWDQDHWLTMNIGGTGPPTWDGEMTPRLKLTAVPYAFQSKQAELLKQLQGSNTGTLDFLSLTANRNISLPDQDGTVVVQSGACTNGQMLKWNSTANEWQCFSGSGASIPVNSSDGLTTTTAGALEFGPGTNSSDEFIVSDQGGGVTRIRLGNSVLTNGNYAATLDSVYVNENQNPASGDISGSFQSGLTINADSVTLGSDTTGDFVASLGTLTGLSVTGNSGEGSTPALSVLYGSTANTAVQGNTTLICPSGTGNLTGGSNTITLGAGGTCGAISTNSAVSFSTSVTTPLLTNSGQLSVSTSATAGADDIVFSNGGNETVRILENGDLRFEKGANDVTFTVATPSGAPAIYTFSGATGTVLTTANYSSTLDGIYVNEGQNPAAGDISGSFASGLVVNSVQNNSVDLSTDTVGNYVATLGTLTGLSVTGNTGEGSTPALSVLYGSGANNAAAGANTFTCSSGTGNLTGGGTVVTIGTSGTVCAAITTNSDVSFNTAVRTPLLTNSGALTVSTTGLNDLTITSGSGLISLNANQLNTASDLTFNLSSASNTLFSITNGGAGVASLNIEGGGVFGGGLNVTGNSTLTGTLAGLTGLTVASGGASITGGLSLLTGSLNISAGVIQTNSTTRIDNGGNLVNIGNITGSGAMDITSGGSGNLTLDSASGTLVVASNDSTLQRTAAGTYNIDLNDAGTTTLRLTNGGSGVANLDIFEGALSTAGTTRLTNSGALQNVMGDNANGVSFNANTITAGTLVTARGGTGLSSFTTNGVLYASSTSGLAQTTGSSSQILIANGSGVPTFATLSGDATISSTGVITIGPNTVALGTDTTGDYVQNIGTLVGLSTTGNSGEGSTPGLSVLYGSTVNTAAQGNTQITCTSGSGNLTGGGTVITIGSGGVCAAINTNNAVTFSTSVSTPLVTNAGLLTVQTTATAGADDILFVAGGTERIRILENGTLVFGTGANSANIYLTANDTLKTDDRLQVALGLDLLSDLGTNVSGLRFGSASDTNLYRAATGILATDGSFGAGGGIWANGVGVNTAWLGLTGASVLGPGISFGSTADTNLYRSAANTLKTDDSLIVSAGLTVLTGGANLSDGGITNAGTIAGATYIDLKNNVANPAYAEGRLFYDNTQKALSYYNSESGVTLNIGQENYVYVYNGTGSTINDGQGVYINGTNAGVPTVGLARADSLATTNTIGVATHSIENGTYGYITTFGEINNINTSGFTAGDTLYVSATTAGTLTNVRPTQPNYTNAVGRVTEVNATTGKILVIIGDSTSGAFAAGRVAFGASDGHLVEDSNFFWDNTNKRLGIGDATPLATLTVGSGDLFQVAGATGNITTAGDLALNGGDLTSTGALTITSAAGMALTLDSGTTGVVNLGIGNNAKTINIGTGSAGDVINIGTNNAVADTLNIGSLTDSLVVNSTGLKVTSAGALSGITTISASGNINTTGVYQRNGSSGETFTCGSNQYINQANVSGGIIIGHSACSGVGLSDERLKTNITTVEDGILDSLKDVRAVTFDYDCTNLYWNTSHTYCDPSRQTGVIAQQLAQVFPELTYQDDYGMYHVRYDALNIYNLKAVTEIAKHLDSSGNGHLNDLSVDGVLHAGTIRADHIEGLDYLGRIDSLESRINALEQYNQTNPGTGPNIDLNNLTVGNLTATGVTNLQQLTVNLGLIAKGALEVQGPATFKEVALFQKDVEFDGQINVLGYTNVQGLTVNLDLITRGSLEVDGTATFKEAVRFEKNATFEGDVAVKGQVTVNQDAAGHVTIKQGDASATVHFTKRKERPPIINLTLGGGKFVPYSYNNVTEDGFDVVLAVPATEDLTFSWSAILTEEVGVVAP